MEKSECRIFIIDDDESVRRSLSLLMKAHGFQSVQFSSVREFLEMEKFTGPGCILLDIFLEVESGLEMQEKIISRFPCFPIIYMTGLGDIPMSVRALKKGAVDFLQKPVNETEVLDAVGEALAISSARVSDQDEAEKTRRLIEKLTRREREILKHVIAGKLNKQIAGELGIAEHTVKLHRARIREKLGVFSVAELVRLTGKINLQ